MTVRDSPAGMLKDFFPICKFFPLMRAISLATPLQGPALLQLNFSSALPPFTIAFLVADAVPSFAGAAEIAIDPELIPEIHLDEAA